MSKDRRQFQPKSLRFGFVAVCLLVIGSASLFILVSYEDVLSNDPSGQTATNRSSGKVDGSARNASRIREGHGISGNTPEEIREAARELDRQLMAKLKQKRLEFEDSSEQYYDAREGDLQAHRERVREDYEQVKNTKHLSKGMKADFKKHFKNITRDTVVQ